MTPASDEVLPCQLLIFTVLDCLDCPSRQPGAALYCEGIDTRPDITSQWPFNLWLSSREDC